MSNKRITDLTELTTPTTDDVFPVVDIASNTTTKVQLGNLPVTTAVTTALATKQDTLVSGTNIKTVNSTSLVGSGNVAVQETLVSGTNIKTLNSTSLLGSGNIVLAATPSGVAGAIQFSNGSAFSSDATNLFWDDTNNRLGVGTNAPTTTLDVVGNVLVTGGSNTYSFDVLPNNGFRLLNGSGSVRGINNFLKLQGTNGVQILSNSIIGEESTPTARLQVKGSGSTSATTSLLVQNSAGTDALRVSDNGIITIGSDLKSGEQLNFYGQYGTRLKILTSSTIDSINGSVINSGLDYSGSNNLILTSKGINSTTNVYIIPSTFTSLSGAVLVNTTTDVASSILTANSTTRGFLPPRMTTTQKNAIASPAAGLVVYDSTTNKLCCYNGSTWNDLF